MDVFIGSGLLSLFHNFCPFRVFHGIPQKYSRLAVEILVISIVPKFMQHRPMQGGTMRDKHVQRRKRRAYALISMRPTRFHHVPTLLPPRAHQARRYPFHDWCPFDKESGKPLALTPMCGGSLSNPNPVRRVNISQYLLYKQN